MGLSASPASRDTGARGLPGRAAALTLSALEIVLPCLCAHSQTNPEESADWARLAGRSVPSEYPVRVRSPLRQRSVDENSQKNAGAIWFLRHFSHGETNRIAYYHLVSTHASLFWVSRRLHTSSHLGSVYRPDGRDSKRTRFVRARRLALWSNGPRPGRIRGLRASTLGDLCLCLRAQRRSFRAATS